VVARVRTLLEAPLPQALATLMAHARAAAEAGRLADDADRERLEALTGVLAALGRLRRAAARQAVLVEAGPAPEALQAFFIARGRVAHRAELSPDGWRGPAAAGLARVRAACAEPEAPIPPEALDEVMIVDERLRQRAGHPGAIALDEGWRELTVLTAVGRAVQRVLEEGPAHAAEDEDPFEAVGSAA
jgi:hypothetical protein